jgi:hypothetical protein
LKGKAAIFFCGYEIGKGDRFLILNDGIETKDCSTEKNETDGNYQPTHNH